MNPKNRFLIFVFLITTIGIIHVQKVHALIPSDIIVSVTSQIIPILAIVFAFASGIFVNIYLFMKMKFGTLLKKHKLALFFIFLALIIAGIFIAISIDRNQQQANQSVQKTNLESLKTDLPL